MGHASSAGVLGGILRMRALATPAHPIPVQHGQQAIRGGDAHFKHLLANRQNKCSKLICFLPNNRGTKQRCSAQKWVAGSDFTAVAGG
jgi:hypothetical protein